jgi:hypothetical protein
MTEWITKMFLGIPARSTNVDHIWREAFDVSLIENHNLVLSVKYNMSDNKLLYENRVIRGGKYALEP